MSRDRCALPMVEGESLLPYFQEVFTLHRQGKLPDLDEEMLYKIYSIRGSSFGDHESIVLSSNDKDFITVELGFRQTEDGNSIYPVSRNLDTRLKHKLRYRGIVKMSATKLVGHAVHTMKEFGRYFKYCNNCQHFCNRYLESIGLTKETSLTDDQIVVRGAAIAGGAIALLAVMFLKSTRERANKNRHYYY